MHETEGRNDFNGMQTKRDAMGEYDCAMGEYSYAIRRRQTSQKQANAAELRSNYSKDSNE